MSKRPNIFSILEQHELSLLEEIDYWKRRATEAENKYSELLGDTIEHNEAMFGNMLKAMLEK